MLLERVDVVKRLDLCRRAEKWMGSRANPLREAPSDPCCVARSLVLDECTSVQYRLKCRAHYRFSW